jgi:protein MBA1
MPDAARQAAEKRRIRSQKQKDEGEEKVESKASFEDNGVPKTVVEYLVLQKRVIRGKEEDWKVWGFAEESTPERIEKDEEYWRKTLDLQAAGGA